MEFGRLESLEGVNFDLPDLDQHQVCLEPGESMQLFFGATSWGCRAWRGKLYPEKTSPSDFFAHYVKHFSSIELNSSFYAIPRPQIARRWQALAPSSFRFCPKLHRALSHQGTGETLWKDFLKFCESFEEQLGTAFMQLPPYLGMDRFDELRFHLRKWSKDIPLCLEFRHPSFFTDQSLHPVVMDFLDREGFGLVVTDVAGRRDVCHRNLVGRRHMIRFVGNALHESDEQRLRSWLKRFECYRSEGLQECYFMVHQPADVKTPETMTLLKGLQEKLFGSELKGYKPPAVQRSLFA